MATIHHLPNEMLLAMLHAVNTPQDLRALISAHPQSLRVFLTDRARILAAVVRNSTGRDVLSAALAANRIPEHKARGPFPSKERLAEDLSRVLRRPVSPVQEWPPASFDIAFPTETDELVRLSRLAALASHFTDGLTKRAAGLIMNHRKSDGSAEKAREGGAEPFKPLSPRERARIQRAFFLYELYCRRFPPHRPGMGAAPHPELVVHAQYTKFARHLAPWEAEELACVHNYLYTLVDRCFKDLEDKVEAAVRSSPSAQAPDITPMMAHMLRGPVHRMGPRSPPDPKALLPFDPQFMGMELFDSPQAKNHQLPRYLTKLVSYGLAYVHRLVSADANQRCAMLLAETSDGRDFLPEALVAGPSVIARLPVLPDADDIRSPSPGFFAYRKLSTYPERNLPRIYAPEYNTMVLQHNGLREMGYAFWGAARLADEAVARALGAAYGLSAGEISSLTRRRRRCLAHRLLNVGINLADRLRVAEEFQFCQRAGSHECARGKLL